jgi:hypothetical protein
MEVFARHSAIRRSGEMHDESWKRTVAAAENDPRSVPIESDIVFAGLWYPAERNAQAKKCQPL